MMARSLAVKAEVKMHWDRLEEANGELDKLDRLVGKVRFPSSIHAAALIFLTCRSSQASCPETTESRRLRADLHVRASMKQEAYGLYLDAQKSLETFVSTASDREAGNSFVSSLPSSVRFRDSFSFS
jgi:hypothetical protein